MNEIAKNIYIPHPARRYSFEDLYSEISARVDAGLIKKQTEKDLEIFTYSRECQSQKQWDVFTLMSRGLILCPKQKKVVATSFCKFFNYNELAVEMPDLPFHIFEKLDGSLGIIYFHNDKWSIATKGSFLSEQAIWATGYLNQNIDLDHLIPGITYLVEIIYPSNKIVINYGNRNDLVLLSAFDHEGQEFNSKQSNNLAKKAGFSRPGIFKYKKIEELLSVAKLLSSQQEGFVVRFDNGYRLKIKGDEYIRIHRLMSKITPIGIWDILRSCDNLELVEKELPEEILIDFHKIKSLIQEQFDGLYDAVQKLHESLVDQSDKDVGLHIQKLSAANSNIHPDVKHFVFACRKKNFLIEVKNQGKLRNAFFKKFRPKNNILQGYESSNVINRFNEEAL